MNVIFIPFTFTSVLTANMLRHSLAFGEKCLSNISFKAEIGNDIFSCKPEDNIVFDKVIENNGCGYDRYSGIFTCPLGGEYFFSVSVTNQVLEQIETEIVLNDDVIMRVNSSARWLKWNQCSPGIVQDLQVRDRVYVRIVNSEKDTFLYSGSFSSFSGFRIK